ncbi:MAG: LON peptidase substrate-binding domain-containing protein [Terriglobia bacterium]
MEDYLPLFPLNVVLLPKMLLPLHIFEERYKELIGHCLDQKLAFGILYSKDNEIEPIGCTALIHQVLKNYPDGRMDIAVLGTNRFRVLYFNSDKAYLRGVIEPYNDDNTESEPEKEELDKLASLYERAFHLIHRGSTEEVFAFPAEAPSFHIAQRLNLDNDLKQQLLNLQSESERVQHLLRYLSEVVVYLTNSHEASQKAGGNGNLRKR